MKLTVLAKRYAAALFEAAKASDSIDLVESDLGLVTYSLESVSQLTEVLEQPLIPIEHKKEIVRDIFSGRVQELTLNFLGLVIEKRRERILTEVEKEYVKLANDYRGIVLVQVTSALPLTSDEKSALRAKLEVFTGKQVELELHEDPTLIGGLVLRIGDTVIDGSVKGYLESLRNQMLGR
ncbi:MAG: F0F1 ATP synthase subunit delta [Armatimonadetes bacterium]|nr:F0F1 ATP synthase subunit delta [Armatimonadota bacterium]